MAIFNGVVSAASSIASDLGILTTLNPASVALAPTSPISVGFQVEDLNPGGSVAHVGGFTLDVPNHSIEFGILAQSTAKEALVLIELAIALQIITDPKGGIRVKDALDPYHYNVIKNALEENGDPVPQPANPGATTLGKLGGIITETGLLSTLATGASALQAFGIGTIGLQVAGPAGIPDGLFNFIPGNLGSPIITEVIGAFPSYSFALLLMNSATIVKTFALQYITSLIRNSIDTEARALLLKNVMSDFTLAVSQNAIEKANGSAPDGTQQEGESGIF
jgi:hypothetical protein